MDPSLRRDDGSKAEVSGITRLRAVELLRCIFDP